MRDWSLLPGDPLSLTLAADMRLCKPDYLNDHIWELEIGGGEPASLAIRTTYGLRARGMRLFYRFAESGRTLTNPAEFQAQPRLRRFYPNFLLLDFVPLDGLEVTAEYWIPESHALAGRLTIVNRTPSIRKVNFELCGALTPLDGQPLAFVKQQMINVLSGRTGGLAPVLFMTGGPKSGPGPHPSLALELDFEPGSTRTVTWVLAAAEGSPEDSFELARHLAGRPWDAERARIELLDAGDILDIYTGDANWDTALAFSQKSALGLFFPASQHLPAPSFVRSRQPDDGYSHKGDGLDYSPNWNGQSPFDAYYLGSLLPAARHLTRDLLQNFMIVQTEDGSIDGKPGLGGQRAKFLSAPMLASLAWNYYQDAQDETFLSDVFPKLLAFFSTWFSPEHDPDRDGIPQWDHVLQTGFDDHPLFDVWHPWSQGVGISALFNPELEALLYREATALILMAEKLDRANELGMLHEHAATLRSSVAAGWNANRALYAYRDRITGQSLASKLIGRHKGSGELRPRKAEFEPAVRLLIEVQTRSPAAKRPDIEIAGFVRAAEGEAERKQGELIEERHFQWRSGGLVATSQKVYCKVGRITIRGLEDNDKVVVRTVDAASEDITLFTPLWAHLPDQQQAQGMLKRSLFDGERFARPFGIPALPSAPEASRSISEAILRTRAEAEAVAGSIHLPWNQLVIEGMLAYGFRDEAAQLTARLMNAVIQSLKQSHAFYERYDSHTGSGLGARGALTGFAPVGLFMQTLGVNILSPTRVRLEGKNPFPWPVTVAYKGLKVVRGFEATEVIFPNGQVTSVTDPAPCVVSL